MTGVQTCALPIYIGPGGVVVDDPNWHQNGTEANKTAKEGAIDEYVGVEPTEGLITALASLLGIGVPLATALYKDLKGKSKEEKKKVLQNISAHMDKTVGGNEPGQGHGVKTGKF